MPVNNQPSLIRMARADGRRGEVAPLALGARVRALRKARNWTLERTAREVGLARSTLSKIENEQMSPTFDALKKLAEGLGISIPQLFTPPKSAPGERRLALVRAGKGATHLTRTYEHELLASALTQKQMLPYRSRIRARDTAEFDGWVRHDGEEFLYVLAGVITFFTEYYAPVEMQTGDSAYYDAEMGHNLISVSPEDAEILWVTSLG